ncbi:MAG TPA: sporulation protein YqfD [Symbiobacteriaceae bacterium]|nr:sporulation protein YqfD [Symbiobacteriaceae bacterium]
MLRRLIAFLLGHLRIEVSGGSIERFLNLTLEHDLTLWHIQRTPEVMRASLTIRDFFALRPVARGAGVRVRIRSRHGFPFLLVNLRRRPALVAGAVACLAFLVWATSHIWVVQVKVTGPHNLDSRAVKAVAAEAGLRWGAWKSDVDTHKVEAHIQERMGEMVSWAIVRVQGTRTVIEVVEKVAVRKQGEVGCVNLVARKPGVIEEIIPFQGEPRVKKGDIVKAGDLLVECSFKYWDGGRPMVLPGTEMPARESTARTLVAQAIVRARVTHTRYQEIPLMQTVEVPTGRTEQRWVLRWKDQSILLRGNNESAFERYQETRQTYGLPRWRNWKAPVELVLVNVREVEARREPVAAEAALEKARTQMEGQLRWMLGPSDKVLKPMQAVILERSREFVGVRTSVETLEEIAQPKAGQPLAAPAPIQTGATDLNPVHP